MKVEVSVRVKGRKGYEAVEFVSAEVSEYVSDATADALTLQDVTDLNVTVQDLVDDVSTRVITQLNQHKAKLLKSEAEQENNDDSIN